MEVIFKVFKWLLNLLVPFESILIAIQKKKKKIKGLSNIFGLSS